VPASDYRALQNQSGELHRLLGKKTLESAILEKGLEHATGSNNSCGWRCRRQRTVPDENRGGSDWGRRSNLVQRLHGQPQKRIGWPPLPDD
jgi:hypothetical protein